jgi:superfamily II DNA or RNA helicase
VTAEQIVERLQSALLGSPPRGVSRGDVRQYFRQGRDDLVELVQSFLGEWLESSDGGMSASARTAANLTALRVLSRLRASNAGASAQESAMLRAYSGWGGLSIERVPASDWPDGRAPESRGLIHEYYTPRRVTDAAAELLARLRDTLPARTLRALEPSAGVGRMVDSVNGRLGEKIDWHLAEWSQLSAAILKALFPRTPLHVGPFESWVAENDDAEFDLVVANPPYGPRGVSVAEDPRREYREKRAYAYFLRRASDLLAPGGLGLWLIPAGFMTGTSAEMVELRRKVFRRHHLECAYRLPSVAPGGREALFPGAMLVTDLVLLRARGGELVGVAPADEGLLRGEYYLEFPQAVLGREMGREGGDDDQTRKPRFGYQVEGDFTGLPTLPMRPIDASVDVEAFRGQGASKRRRVGVRDAVGARLRLEGASQAVRAASALGQRVDAYLNLVSTGKTAAALAQHAELLDDVQAWLDSGGLTPEVVGWMHQDDAVGRLLANVNKAGAVSSSLKTPPTPPRVAFSGSPSSPSDVLRWLGREGVNVSEALLNAALADIRGPSVSAMYEAAVGQGWGLDAESGALVPPPVAWFGNLWAKYDAALSAASSRSPVRAVGDAAWQATMRAQSARLLELIAPVTFSGVGRLSPLAGWIPVEQIEGWLAAETNEVFSLERREAVMLRGQPYSALEKLSSGLRERLGWINHDRDLFSPRTPNRETKKDDVRLELAERWTESFQVWVESNAEAVKSVTEAYNRTYRGFRPQVYSGEDLGISRWGPQIQLNPHQVSAARRVLDLGGGLVAFDVGVGKTYTAAAIIARAKQDRQARRPVVVVPNTLTFQWKASLEKALPDYRVLVIGASAVVGRDGKVRSQLDTPKERGEKWSQFQAGLFDVCVLSYSALARTKMSLPVVQAFAASSAPLKRIVNEERAQALETERKTPSKLTERQRAILTEGAAGFMRLRLELPETWEYDPGPAWDEVGIDLLVVDEAQNFKNWWLPAAREHGVPRFMGNAGDGSARAWQLAVRAYAVRQKHPKGKGIVLLSATPAKNSPLEFYSLYSYLGSQLWESFGVFDSEQFIDQFCLLKKTDIISPSLEVVSQMACVGFGNLDALRTVLFTHGEFKTAAQVGLKVPEPKPQQVMVDMDAAQQRIYDVTADELQSLLSSGQARRNPGAVLAALARLNAAALHPDLVKSSDREPWTFDSAAKAAASGQVDADSAKLRACVDRILRSPGCGHVVFCDFVAVHAWLKALLVQRGVDAAKVGVMNAQTTKSAADRSRLAERFNNAELDVIIVNAVAYEGIDLQRRTCSLHHLDLPWEPATLQQRNGRGVRQGNEYESVDILVYMAARSVDGLRFQTIQGKRRWMDDVIEGSASAINNPGAQVGVPEDELLIALSRDPEKARARIDAMRTERSAAAKWTAHLARMGLLASALRRRASGGPEEVAEYIARELPLVEASSWVWASFARSALERGGTLSFIPPERRQAPNDSEPALMITGTQQESLRWGVVSGNNIAMLRGAPGELKWTSLEVARYRFSDADPALLNLDPDINIEAIRQAASRVYWSSHVWKQQNWWLADEAWLASVWPVAEPFIRSRWPSNEAAPRRMSDNLSATTGEFLPPTSEAWSWFVARAPDLAAQGWTWTDIASLGKTWWGSDRSLPRDALTRRSDETAALGDVRRTYEMLRLDTKTLRDNAIAVEAAMYGLLRGSDDKPMQERSAIEADLARLMADLEAAITASTKSGETLDVRAVERRLGDIRRRWTRLGDQLKPLWLRLPVNDIGGKTLRTVFFW